MGTYFDYLNEPKKSIRYFFLSFTSAFLETIDNTLLKRALEKIILLKDYLSNPEFQYVKRLSSKLYNQQRSIQIIMQVGKEGSSKLFIDLV